MPKTMLLYYDPNHPGWETELKRMCAVRGIRFRRLGARDLGLTVADLFLGTSPSAEPATIPLLPEPMLLFDGLSNSALDRILLSLDQIGIPRAVLKAVLTPTNASWTLPKLWSELEKEHFSFL